MKRDANKLYCFSPPIMIATFAIEFAMAVYTVWRYTLNEVTKLVVALLVFLALFQAAEFMVCEGPVGGSLLWSRVGFVAITMLPALGIHLVYALVGAKKRALQLPAYGVAAGFGALFVGMSSAFSGQECLGNYVIFQVAPGLGGLYATYYYVSLAVALTLAWRFMQKAHAANVRRALSGLMLGYAAFIVPTATVNLLSPDTIRGVPSIMCGFAVLLAIMLMTMVLPGVAIKRKEA
jgi:hypothetical protein